MKTKFWFLVILLASAGCASAPVRGGLPVYSINDAEYLPLASVCDLSGISWDYDAFSRVVTLAGDKHVIKLRVGDNLMLVDSRLARMKYPVDMHDGAIVVPVQFKDDTIDILFRRDLSLKTEYPDRSKPALLASLKIKKIAIDAGHGGVDPGAIGRSGLYEKNVNLDVANRLRDILVSKGIEVVMTRPGDKFIALPKRTEIANASRSELFVSIHSNANNSRRLNGFEVYYVSTTVDDYKRAISAVKEGALNLDGASFANRSPVLKTIVWDMIYTANRGEAIELSHDICRAIDNKLSTSVRGVKDARYEVLRGTRMPAVLVEIGFLSNADEERLLKTGDYRQKMAEALADGILNYSREFRITEAGKR